MKNPGLLEDKLAAHFCSFASVVALCLLGLTVQIGHAATLTHRYSFDTDAADSVGSANGVLLGNAYIANGALVLDGTNSSVQLPDNLFTNYNSATFELWFRLGTTTSPQALLYTFGRPGPISGCISYQLQGKGGTGRPVKL